MNTLAYVHVVDAGSKDRQGKSGKNPWRSPASCRYIIVGEIQEIKIDRGKILYGLALILVAAEGLEPPTE